MSNSNAVQTLKRPFLGVMAVRCAAKMGLNFVLGLLLFLVFPAPKGMQKKVEQRANLKFLMASGKKPIECWHALKDIYGRDAMSQTQVWVWHERFCSSDMSVQDKARTGRPRTVRIPRNVQKVQKTLDNDRRTSIHDLEMDTGLRRSTVAQNDAAGLETEGQCKIHTMHPDSRTDGFPCQIMPGKSG